MSKSKYATTEKWLTLVPAYGRDYKTAEAVLKDWKEHKDFLIQDISSKDRGRYVNCDAEQEYKHPDIMGTTYKIRYGTILNTGFKLPNFVLIKLIDEKWTIVGKSDGTENEEGL